MPLIRLWERGSSLPDTIITAKIFVLIAKGLILGVIIGQVTGSIIATAQNLFMQNSKYGFRWAIYNIMVWTISCSLVWIIIIPVEEFIDYDFIVDSAAAALMFLIHGLGIIFFLDGSPELEFS